MSNSSMFTSAELFEMARVAHATEKAEAKAQLRWVLVDGSFTQKVPADGEVYVEKGEDGFPSHLVGEAPDVIRDSKLAMRFMFGVRCALKKSGYRFDPRMKEWYR